MGSTAPRTSLPTVTTDGIQAVHPPVSAEPRPARYTPRPGWASVGEALTGKNRPHAVLERCRVVGRDLAEAGASVGEGLAGLRSTTLLVSGREPTFEETLAVADGWAEATLSWLNRLSCTEPMTGLATQPHVHEVLRVYYRRGVAGRHVLVVVELPVPHDFVAHTRLLTLVGSTAGSAFVDASAVARLGVRRIAVLATRGPTLQPRASLLRRMLEDLPVRLWLEPLPDSEDSATWLLEELAR